MNVGIYSYQKNDSSEYPNIFALKNYANKYPNIFGEETVKIIQTNICIGKYSIKFENPHTVSVVPVGDKKRSHRGS